MEPCRGPQPGNGRRSQLWGSGDQQQHIAVMRTNSFGTRPDIGGNVGSGPRQDNSSLLDSRRFSYSSNFSSSSYNNINSGGGNYSSHASSPAYSPVQSPNTSRNQSPMNIRVSSERPGSGGSVGSGQGFHPITSNNNNNSGSSSSSNSILRNRSGSSSSLLGGSPISNQNLNRSAHNFDHASNSGYDVRVPSVIPLPPHRVSSPELPPAFATSSRQFPQYGLDFNTPKDFGDLSNFSNLSVGRAGSFAEDDKDSILSKLNSDKSRFPSGTSDSEFSMFNNSS